MSSPSGDIASDLVARASRAAVVSDVQTVLAVNSAVAEKITALFERFVAEPLSKKLHQTKGTDLARRNPMIYTARGVDDVNDWVSRVLEDRETSAIEGHIGTFLEEVAIAISNGFKPGSGVDLQLQATDGTVHLYAIQTSSNTKNAGSRRSDIVALKQAARPLRAAKRHVELHVAVLHGRGTTGTVASEPDIDVLSSDAFWATVSGQPDFRARLLKASIALARLVEGRAADEIERIRNEARSIFGTDSGGLDVEALASPPRPTRSGTKE